MYSTQFHRRCISFFLQPRHKYEDELKANAQRRAQKIVKHDLREFNNASANNLPECFLLDGDKRKMSQEMIHFPLIDLSGREFFNVSLD